MAVDQLYSPFLLLLIINLAGNLGFAGVRFSEKTRFRVRIALGENNGLFECTRTLMMTRIRNFNSVLEL